jgi:hypothetical protein
VFQAMGDRQGDPLAGHESEWEPPSHLRPIAVKRPFEPGGSIHIGDFEASRLVGSAAKITEP